MVARRRRNPRGASWERGYNGHVYRDPKGQELGRVTRVGRPVHLYAWSTDGCRGSGVELAIAKRLVAAAVRWNLCQGQGFGESVRGGPEARLAAGARASLLVAHRRSYWRRCRAGG